MLFSPFIMMYITYKEGHLLIWTSFENEETFLIRVYPTKLFEQIPHPIVLISSTKTATTIEKGPRNRNDSFQGLLEEKPSEETTARGGFIHYYMEGESAG